MPKELFTNVDLALMAKEVSDTSADVKSIKQKLECEYATKEWCITNYGQTKKIVNGIIGLVITAVFGGLLTLLLK